MFLESKFLKLSNDMSFERNILLLKLLQGHVDLPFFLVWKLSFFCLVLAIYQKFQRLHFLINLFESLDVDAK